GGRGGGGGQFWPEAVRLGAAGDLCAACVGPSGNHPVGALPAGMARPQSGLPHHSRLRGFDPADDRSRFLKVMSIVLFGVNHKSAPLEVRERLTFPPEGLPEALHRFTGIPSFSEALILSTCNRTELLAHASARGTAEGAEAMK